MKIKILKCSEPEAWYADKIGEEFEVEFMPEEKRRDPDEHFIIKDWNWYWRRDLPHKTIVARDVTITDKSGSVMADGYQLGVAHGKALEERRLIKEGILIDEPEYDDEPVTLHL